jgi:hypothetical protein
LAFGIGEVILNASLLHIALQLVDVPYKMKRQGSAKTAPACMNKPGMVKSCGAWCCTRCCTFDNRGIGSSTIPENLPAYKTGIMAADVKALMDHLGWHKAHIMGMSLGGKQTLTAEDCHMPGSALCRHMQTAELKVPAR